jgi:inositol 1,4,5-triphosphate receptor type 1/inositol 1,4,5-triphosphate receptor type 3
VLPRGAFDIHDEYIKSGPVQRELLAPRMRTEADQYNIIIQNRFNEEIIFGAEVIFKHIDSEEYLFGSYQCSDFSTDAFKVQLVKLLSSSTVF